MRPAFTVGFSGSREDLDNHLDQEGIESVYTGGLMNRIAGGRPQYCSSLEEIAALASMARKKNIQFEIALNAPCGIEDSTNRDWWQTIRDYLKDLENAGVTGIIASHPFIMNAVKTNTNLRLTASTICEIQTCRSAVYYEGMGADIIIPSMNCNYDLDLLFEMKQALHTAEIRLMANEHCLCDCPWRRFHHNHYAHSSFEMDYHIKCKKVYADNPYLLLANSVIRPEDLGQYEQIIQHFKIVGRQLPIDYLLEIVRAYTSGQYAGNFVYLFDKSEAEKTVISNPKLDQLFAIKSKCKKNCYSCSVCKKMYESTQKER